MLLRVDDDGRFLGLTDRVTAGSAGHRQGTNRAQGGADVGYGQAPV